MSRFLIVAFSDAGHLNPLIAVAQHLEAGGHEVTIFSSQGELSARLQHAQLRARFVGGGATGAAHDPVELVQRLAKPKWAQRYLRETLIDKVPELVDPLRVILRDTKPDVVACDPMAYAGVIAAELEGIPWAGLSTGFFALIPPTWPTPVRDVFDAIAPTRAQLFARFGLQPRFRLSDAVSPALNVVFTSEAVIGRDLAENDDVVYVGPPRPIGRRGDERTFPWERLPGDRPLVYVAFGSHLSPPREVYDALFAALGPDEACFVVALKGLAADAFASSLPAHVVAVEYAPQLELLRRAAAMVNHGGANSVMECLAAGCPMLVVPLLYNQPAVGRIVEAAGAGVAVEPAKLTVATAREHLRAMLAPESPLRARARAIQASLGDGGGAAAELLARLASG